MPLATKYVSFNNRETADENRETADENNVVKMNFESINDDTSDVTDKNKEDEMERHGSQGVDTNIKKIRTRKTKFK